MFSYTMVIALTMSDMTKKLVQQIGTEPDKFPFLKLKKGARPLIIARQHLREALSMYQAKIQKMIDDLCYDKGILLSYKVPMVPSMEYESEGNGGTQLKDVQESKPPVLYSQPHPKTLAECAQRIASLQAMLPSLNYWLVRVYKKEVLLAKGDSMALGFNLASNKVLYQYKATEDEMWCEMMTILMNSDAPWPQRAQDGIDACTVHKDAAQLLRMQCGVMLWVRMRSWRVMWSCPILKQQRTDSRAVFQDTWGETLVKLIDSQPKGIKLYGLLGQAPQGEAWVKAIELYAMGIQYMLPQLQPDRWVSTLWTWAE
ncbi:hypothetical protein K439DRAFT_1621546 [Ramaria rubella]|nr:hypothetical protein K439DRAFT_1621546 [Ramaria rubella]